MREIVQLETAPMQLIFPTLTTPPLRDWITNVEPFPETMFLMIDVPLSPPATRTFPLFERRPRV